MARQPIKTSPSAGYDKQRVAGLMANVGKNPNPAIQRAADARAKPQDRGSLRERTAAAREKFKSKTETLKSGPSPVAPQAAVAQPQVPSGPTIFDIQRQRAQQQVGAEVQSQQDAIKRRAAASGNINSGAFLKLGQQAAEKGREALTGATEGINAQEQQQKLAQSEAELGRQFAREERVGSEKFAGRQSELARKLQKSQFADQMKATYAQMKQDRWVNERNVDIANKTLAKKSFLDQMFGPVGYAQGSILGGVVGSEDKGPLGGALGGGDFF